MKRMLMILVLLTTLLSAASAMAATEAVTRPVTEDDRTRLMLTESRKSKILGKYYGGVPVTVLETKGDMARVDVFGRTGWMALERLCLAGDADYEALSAGPAGMPGIMVQTFTLYDVHPGYEDIGMLTEDSEVRVLGIATSDQFLHVMAVGPDGTMQTGLTLNGMVGRADEHAWVTLDSGKADKKINIRVAPTKKAQALGMAYSGVAFRVLYDWAEPKEGWTHVRAGCMYGYVMTNFLREGRETDWQPPVALLRGEEAVWYSDAEKSCGRYRVTNASAYTLLAEVGDYCCMRRDDPDGSVTYGYLRRQDVQTKGKSTRNAQ